MLTLYYVGALLSETARVVRSVHDNPSPSHGISRAKHEVMVIFAIEMHGDRFRSLTKRKGQTRLRTSR